MGHSGSKCGFGQFRDWTPGDVGRGGVSNLCFDMDPRRGYGDVVTGDSFLNPPVLFDQQSKTCLYGTHYFGKHYQIVQADNPEQCVSKFLDGAKR